MSAPFAVAFEKRSHLLTDDPPFRITGQPVVAMCGTVFVPTDFDPGDSVPRCRPCYEAQVALYWHMSGHYMDLAVAMQNDLNADPARGFCGYHDRPQPCLECQ